MFCTADPSEQRKKESLFFGKKLTRFGANKAYNLASCVVNDSGLPVCFLLTVTILLIIVIAPCLRQTPLKTAQ